MYGSGCGRKYRFRPFCENVDCFHTLGLRSHPSLEPQIGRSDRRLFLRALKSQIASKPLAYTWTDPFVCTR